VIDQTVFIFKQELWFFYSMVFLLGLMVGSFLNVVIYRLPKMMQREWRSDCLEFLEQPAEEKSETFNLVLPRSRCGNCGHQITARENIPVISYLFLGGKCSSCKSHISIQYPLVELFTGVISFWVAWHFGVTLQTLFALILSWTLIAASGIDIGHKLLPDSMTLPLMWLGILLGFFNVFVNLETSVIGAMAGYMSLWSVYIVFKIFTGKEGMGHGDFKLLAMLGAWMGWKLLLVIVLTSSLVGAIVGLGMIALKKTSRATQIPFGPYLAAAGWISLLYGEQLNRFYFSFL
jgi:leader peptidase (prepilin peptidase) / N-methyltransferase